jgi:hypothetical protein
VADHEPGWKAVKFRSREDGHLLDIASCGRPPIYSFHIQNDGSTSLKPQGLIVGVISENYAKLDIDDASQQALLTDTLDE